jgi:Arc/MetJ-type ribon-helix-helix transcriptional regulator
MDTFSTEDSVSVTIRFSPEMLDGIDRYRHQVRYRPTRSAVIRTALEEWLKMQPELQYKPPRQPQHQKRVMPDEKAA